MLLQTVKLNVWSHSTRIGKSVFSEEETKEEYENAGRKAGRVRGVASQMKSKQDMLER